MGEYFAVSALALQAGEEDEKNMERTLERCFGDVEDVRRCLRDKIKFQSGIDDALRKTKDKLDIQKKDMGELRTALGHVRRTYVHTEDLISGKRTETIKFPTWEEIRNALITVGEGLAISAWSPGMGLGYIIGSFLEDGEWESKTKFGDFKHKKKTKDNLRDDHYEFDGKKWVKKEKEKKEKKKSALLNDIKVWSEKFSGEANLIEYALEQETDWGKYGFGTKIGHVEGEASGYLTMGGIGAEAGLALSALTLSGDAQFGDDTLGAHVSGDIELLSAEAKGKFKAGWLNDKGELDPTLSGKVSAEAVLASVSGTAGIDVLGADVDVSGKVGVGVGAHATIGYSEGKIQADIGAYLGVGGSVSLEIDVSGAIDTVANVASNVGSAIENVGSAVGGAANAVGDFVGGVGENLASGWNTLTSWMHW